MRGFDVDRRRRARSLMWAFALVFIIIALAALFGPRVAHSQEFNGDQLALTTNLVTGVNIAPVTVLQKDKPWTLETYYATRSAFKAFGSVASDDPIVGTSLEYIDEEWDAFLLVVEPIGTHEVGVIADFGDLIIQRKFSLGEWSGKVGAEVFYGPGYRGGESSTFLAPLASVSKSLSRSWSFEMGAQYVGTYKTSYGDGDRLFGYGELSYSYTKGPWTVSSLFGAIASDKGRTSIYVRPRVALATPWVLLKLALLREESDSQNGKFSIPATPSITASWTF